VAEQVVAVARRELPELRLRVAWGVAPERIPTLLRASDALLFTSLSEGSPNAVKEAMAAELPIVSTAVGDAPERLRGLPGCHVGPPDAERLAAALVEAVRHGRVPEAREAVAPLSVERVAERVLDVYAEALGRRRARR
jgi:glycosyltransferase involved in cell wall biosynthesis